MNPNDSNNPMEKPVIIIDELPEAATGQDEGEKPVITIERTNEPPASAPLPPNRRWPWVAGSVVITGMLCLLVWLGFRYFRTRFYIGVPVSTTTAQNIAKMQSAAMTDADVSPEVVKTTDSILGVAMNIYELRGLRAEIAMNEPDTTDASVYLYSRCSDYHPDFKVIGDLVIGGQEMPTANERRIGYLAADRQNYTIGIALDDKAKQYAMQTGGCFFRQFVLVSDCTLPSTFSLHGKVERRAIGRTTRDGKDVICYVETMHRETMWDFADALREYGFIDAIYITGGRDFGFYRSADGQRHDFGDAIHYPHPNADRIPWLIFRPK